MAQHPLPQTSPPPPPPPPHPGVYIAFEKHEHERITVTAVTDCEVVFWELEQLSVMATLCSPALSSFWRNFTLCQARPGCLCALRLLKRKLSTLANDGVVAAAQSGTSCCRRRRRCCCCCCCSMQHTSRRPLPSFSGRRWGWNGTADSTETGR